MTLKLSHRWPALLSTFLFVSFSSCAGKTVDARATEPPSFEAKDTVESHAAQEQYGLKSSHEKRVDNRGIGDENLYGTRNVRAILANAVYRGGANNVKNRHGSRPNQNPLPKHGLEALCREGFDTAVYLYSAGYATSPKNVTCVNRRTGKENRLEYLQMGPYSEKTVREFLELTHRKVKLVTNGETPAPAYYHCWNGWHASGLISAYILRQFCDYSGDEAVAYWDLNTDGNNKDPAFAKLRTQMRNFKPYADLKISDAEKTQLCLPLK